MKINIHKKNKVSGFTPTPNFLKKENLVWGFTLIELMVAISIFMMIMTMAMGSLLVTLDAKKKAEALSFTMDNLNFAMESMTRNLRMGKNYDCTGIDRNCPDGNYGVMFNSSEKFSLGTGKIFYFIEKRDNSNYNTIKRCSSILSSSCVDIIADNINIYDTSKFYVKGVGDESPNLQIQPSIYIKINGSVTVKGDEIPFAIQTIVSQRSLEFY